MLYDKIKLFYQRNWLWHFVFCTYPLLKTPNYHPSLSITQVTPCFPRVGHSITLNGFRLRWGHFTTSFVPGVGKPNENSKCQMTRCYPGRLNGCWSFQLTFEHLLLWYGILQGWGMYSQICPCWKLFSYDLKYFLNTVKGMFFPWGILF